MEQEEDEGLSLIEIINRVKVFFTELRRKWFKIAIVACITSLIGLSVSFYLKPHFIAGSTIMLDNGESDNSISGALALASQLGLGGGSSSSSMTEDKLVEIIPSEVIIKTALFKRTIIDSTSDILANHFINLFGYKKTWEKDDSLKNFRFKNPKEHLSLLENKVFKMFYGQIIKDFLKIDKSKSGIMTITVKSKSELFSKYLDEFIVEALTDFYSKHIAENGRMNLIIVQNRVDSVANALKDAELALANWRDHSNQLVKARGMMEELRLTRNVELCSAIYLEGIKQLEITKYSLLQPAHLLQVIDKPMLPLFPEGQISPVKGITIGFILGVLLAGIFVYVKKYIEQSIEIANAKK